MDMEVFLQKESIFPGVHKIGAAISGPRIADTNFTDTLIFLIIQCKIVMACQAFHEDQLGINESNLQFQLQHPNSFRINIVKIYVRIVCWIRAASGPSLENHWFPLKVGLTWVFVNLLKWVQKWVKNGFLGAKVGQNASKPSFAPTLNSFKLTN